jgi:predicted phage terminase large subunit-like protein
VTVAAAWQVDERPWMVAARARTAWARERIEAVTQCLEGRDTPARDLERALAEEASRSLASFTAQLWHVLEPTTALDWWWHLDLICDTLERVSAGELRRVLLCVPPGTAKSLITSVMWPSKWWLNNPSERFLTLSSSDKIAIRDSRRMRDVVRSPWYRRLVAQQVASGRIRDWTLAKDQSEKVRFESTARGGRFGFSTGGSITGERGNGVLVDDPHQIKDVLGTQEHISLALGKAHEKMDVVLPTRVNDRRTAWFVTMLQRVHQEDVASREIDDPDVYKVILPMHAYEVGDPWRHPDDPREPGELLDPVRLPEELVRKEAAKLERQAPGQAAAQHEMRPVPAGGATFKRAWMRNIYDWDPQRPIRPYTEVAITVDATFKKTKSGAFNSFQVWGRYDWVRYFLLDEIHERISFVDQVRILKDLEQKWRPDFTLVELKGNGEAIVDELKLSVPSVIGFMPDRYGDKMTRAQLATSLWQGEGVWLPDSERCPWISDWKNEVAMFPGSTLKDRVDSMSQLFLHWKEKRGNVNEVEAFVAAAGGFLASLGG